MKISLNKDEFDTIYNFYELLDNNPCKTENCGEPFCTGCDKRFEWERQRKEYHSLSIIKTALENECIANYARAVVMSKSVVATLDRIKKRYDELINEINENSKGFEVKDENNAIIAFPHFERKE